MNFFTLSSEKCDKRQHFCRPTTCTPKISSIMSQLFAHRFLFNIWTSSVTQPKKILRFAEMLFHWDNSCHLEIKQTHSIWVIPNFEESEVLSLGLLSDWNNTSGEKMAPYSCVFSALWGKCWHTAHVVAHACEPDVRYRYSHDGQTGPRRPLLQHTQWWQPGNVGWSHRSCCPAHCVWLARHQSSSPWWRPYQTRGGTWSCGTEDAMSSEGRARRREVSQGEPSIAQLWRQRIL